MSFLLHHNVAKESVILDGPLKFYILPGVSYIHHLLPVFVPLEFVYVPQHLKINYLVENTDKVKEFRFCLLIISLSTSQIIYLLSIKETTQGQTVVHLFLGHLCS